MTWLGLIALNLLRRPGRSFFTLVGVALAVGGCLTLIGLSQGLTEGTQVSMNERRIDLVVTRRGMIEVFGGSLPESLQARIAAVPGVEAVSAELDTFLQVADDTHAVVAGWRDSDFEFREMPLLRGRLPRAGAGEVVLGDQLAEALKLDLDDEVELNFAPYRVVGVSRFGSGIMRGTAIMPLADAQSLLARPGQVTLFQVRLKDPGRPGALDAARSRIAALAPGLSVSGTAEALSSSKTIAMLSAASLAIALVAMCMAGFSVLNTLAMAVEERTREIGILSTIGWSRARILSLILSEGMLLAAVGGVIGVGIGYLGNQVLSLLVLPGSGLSSGSTLRVSLEALAAAVLVGALGSAWPAWRAAHLSPARAMQRQ
jgi:putative ABC transport system permease protein